MEGKKEILEAQLMARCRPMIGSALVAILLGFSAGTAQAYSATALPHYESENTTTLDVELTPDQGSWFVSIVPITSMCGVLVSGFIMDGIGRKSTLVLAGSVLLLGWLLVFFAGSFVVLITGRIITGVGCGFTYPTVLTWLCEVSLVRFRGVLGVSNTFFSNSGWLLGFVLGACLPLRYIMMASVAPVFVFLSLVYFIPESPLWLVRKGNIERAEKNLRWLRGEEYNVALELEEMMHCSSNQKDNQSKLEAIGFFFTKPVLLPFALVSTLFLVQVFCGAEGLLYYSYIIFRDAKITLSEYVVSVLLQLGFTAGYVVSLPCMSRIGRKTQYVLSGSLMAICLSSLGTCFYFREYVAEGTALKTFLNTVPIICLIGFSFAYSIGFGPVCYAILGEIFPVKAKGIGSSLVLSSRFLFLFGMLKVYPFLMATFGLTTMVWLHAAICIMGCIFMMVLVPETKGLTLTELTGLFDEKKNCEKEAKRENFTFEKTAA